jgi:hypothetical protein
MAGELEPAAGIDCCPNNKGTETEGLTTVEGMAGAEMAETVEVAVAAATAGRSVATGRVTTAADRSVATGMDATVAAAVVWVTEAAAEGA